MLLFHKVFADAGSCASLLKRGSSASLKKYLPETPSSSGASAQIALLEPLQMLRVHLQNFDDSCSRKGGLYVSWVNGVDRCGSALKKCL